MITIGGDSHKRTHTFVAVDDLGRQIAETTVAASELRTIAMTSCPRAMSDSSTTDPM